MGCCLELILLAFGGFLIAGGELKLGGKTISGAMVRVAGVIYALPFPLCFLIGFYIGYTQGLKGQTRMSKDWMGVLGLMELGIMGGCVVLGSLMLAFASLNTPKQRQRRDGFGFDADYPYVAERQRRIDFDEVFDSHGPPPPMVLPVPPPEHAEAVVAQRPAPNPPPRTL